MLSCHKGADLLQVSGDKAVATANQPHFGSVIFGNNNLPSGPDGLHCAGDSAGNAA
nr:Uncharacterised protein [Raoultella sp. NCTC 9187]